MSHMALCCYTGITRICVHFKTVFSTFSLKSAFLISRNISEAGKHIDLSNWESAL